MKSSVAVIAIGICFWLSSLPSNAQQYPTKPIRVIAPASAGGLVDAVGRTISSELAKSLKQPVVFENRPGNFGRIAVEVVRNSAPDGYSLLLGGTEITAAETRLREGQLTVLEPVALVASVPFVIVVGVGSKFSTLGNIFQAAQTRQLKIGAVDYFSMLLSRRLQLANKVKFSRVELKSANEVGGALLSGDLDLAITSYPNARPLLEADKLRAVAATVRLPTSRFQSVPTIAQTSPSTVQPEAFIGVFAPLGTPPGVVQTLNNAINESLRSADTVSQLAALGVVPRGGPPDALRVAIRNIIAALPDPCKVKNQCDADPECPKPCPE